MMIDVNGVGEFGRMEARDESYIGKAQYGSLELELFESRVSRLETREKKSTIKSGACLKTQKYRLVTGT